MLEGEVTHVVKVDHLAGEFGVIVARRYPVGDETPRLGRHRSGRAVREMTALVQAHRKNRVTRVQ